MCVFVIVFWGENKELTVIPLGLKMEEIEEEQTDKQFPGDNYFVNGTVVSFILFWL